AHGVSFFSLPCSGFFSPFPHGTGSLSVSQEYLGLPDGAGRFKQDFSCPALLRILLENYCSRVRGYPSYGRASHPVPFNITLPCAVLQPQCCRNNIGLG